MQVRLTTVLASLTLIALCGCSDGGGSANDGGTQSDVATDSTTQSDGATTDGGGGGAHGLGAACTCAGAECEQLGVPKPAGGTISGCEDVATNIPGAALVCLRSYNGALGPATYFANGYCSLMSDNCTGAALICDSAVFGDYATMTTCPAGSVMVTDSQDMNIVGQAATVGSKMCAKACTGNADCRAGETDPVLANAATQYQCIDKGGVKFCQDPRNLSANYTVTAF